MVSVKASCAQRGTYHKKKVFIFLCTCKQRLCQLGNRAPLYSKRVVNHPLKNNNRNSAENKTYRFLKSRVFSRLEPRALPTAPTRASSIFNPSPPTDRPTSRKCERKSGIGQKDRKKFRNFLDVNLFSVPKNFPGF